MFNSTNKIEKNFGTYVSTINEVEQNLKKWDEENSVYSNSITKIRENFIKKTNDFYREDRKLRIAVIGQVKAGKSSFLNTLLFDGKEVLPKAATPKTANLTVIKYGEANFIEIEFYTEKEWEELKKLSKIDADTDEVKVAKEIIEMVKKRDLNVSKYIGKTDYKIEFNSYEELLGRLNDFAGENGEMTPIVKSLQMTISNESIKEIEIVDTPGMNDPIVSRTDKTRQFIEFCDVVFFLSRCPKFLDKTDMDLLTRQLPQKGVSKMILIGSQYDSAINDVIWDKGSFDSADVDCKKRLKERANKEFSELINRLEERNTDKAITKVIENCKVPILVSSMAHNMSKKEKAFYNDEEMIVENGISEITPLTKGMLISLGNFAKVKDVFEDVVEKKDLTLSGKAKNFIPTSAAVCTGELEGLRSKIEKRAMLLQQNDLENIKKSRKQTLSKKNGIQADVEDVFGNLMVKIDKSRVELFTYLRKDINNNRNVSERTGTEEKTGYREVSDSSWYNPFSWGDTRSVAYNYTAAYTYLDVNDAVESIRRYADESSSNIERTLSDVIDISKAKKELLNVVIQNFETSDENFDPAYFRLLVEKTLSQIEVPAIKIDIGKEMQQITSKFSGEIREGNQKSAMMTALGDSLHNVYSSIESILVGEFAKMKATLQKLKDNLANQLLGDITKELDVIEVQFKDREKELMKNKDFLDSIDKCLKIVREI